MHTLLDHDGHISAFTTVTDARTHESRIDVPWNFLKASSSFLTRASSVITGSDALWKEAYFLCQPQTQRRL